MIEWIEEAQIDRAEAQARGATGAQSGEHLANETRESLV
jgi:hypothetical protein